MTDEKKEGCSLAALSAESRARLSAESRARPASLKRHSDLAERQSAMSQLGDSPPVALSFHLKIDSSGGASLPPGPWRWITPEILASEMHHSPVLALTDVDGARCLATARTLTSGLMPLTPEHPVARAIAALPNLIGALQLLATKHAPNCNCEQHRDGLCTCGCMASRVALTNAGLR